MHREYASSGLTLLVRRSMTLVDPELSNGADRLLGPATAQPLSTNGRQHGEVLEVATSLVKCNAR